MISPHGNYSGKLSKRRRLLKAIYKKFFELPCANGASLIHSMGDRKDIEEFGYRGAIVDIPNGYAMDAYLESSGENRVVTKIPTAKGKRQILFIGRLDLEQKGLDLLLEGFGRAEMNETVLVIVGPAWKNGLDRVKNILERSCLSEEQVIFYGAAFGQEKADLLHAADFFVHTSRWEGFPMAVIEAMAYRKVCLVTPAADPLGVLAEGGNGIPLDPNPDSIARAFKEAANLPKKKLEMMGSGARNIVEARFSWEGVAKSMVEAYAAINSK